MQLSKEYFQTGIGEYHRSEAMHFAQFWHSGQFSELYKLSSSGHVDCPISLLSEIEACEPNNDGEYIDGYSDDMQLDCLKAYALELIREFPINDE